MPENFDYETALYTDGVLTADIFDEDGDPNKVIDSAAPSHIEVKWSLRTKYPWILPGTTFHLSATAELIGSGEVTPLANKNVLVDPGQLDWDEKLDITPVVPPQPPLPDGAYKIVLLLTHTAPFMGTDLRTHLAGFVEIPMVQFYTHD